MAIDLNSKQQLKVLWVVPGSERYGVATLTLALAVAMKRRGHQVKLALIGGGFMVEQCEEKQIPYEIIDHPPLPMLGGSLLKRFASVSRMNKETKKIESSIRAALGDWVPDVVHCSRPNFVVLAGRLACSYSAIPIWEMPNLINREIPMDLAWRYYNHVCQKHQFIVLADSAFTGKTLESKKVKPITFYHALNDDRFDPDLVQHVGRKEFGLDASHAVTGVIARVCKSKGQHLVAEAVMNLAKDYPKLRCVFFGGHQQQGIVDATKAKVEQRGMQDVIQFPGNITDVEKYYGLFDFTINARIEPEPFGLSVIESMLMEKPVLVHALGGPAETVLDGKTGWHYHEPTVQAVERGLRRAMEQQASWSEMGKFSRQHAIDNFGETAIVERYTTAIYGRLGLTPAGPSSTQGQLANVNE